jgi:hypothetical protein
LLPERPGIEAEESFVKSMNHFLVIHHTQRFSGRVSALAPA